MFCKKCGNQLNDDASFCPKCGTPVNRNADGTNYDASGKQSILNEKKKLSKRLLICIACAGILAVALIGYLIFTSTNKVKMVEIEGYTVSSPAAEATKIQVENYTISVPSEYLLQINSKEKGNPYLFLTKQNATQDEAILITLYKNKQYESPKDLYREFDKYYNLQNTVIVFGDFEGLWAITNEYSDLPGALAAVTDETDFFKIYVQGYSGQSSKELLSVIKSITIERN
jgi:hypothetical protein